MPDLTLYHGSEYVIEKPVFGKGRPDTDYGQGFYCTESLDLAKEWACKYGNPGFANCYSLDTTGLKLLDLEDRKYNAMNWLALLLEHRDFDLSSDRGESRKKRIIDRYCIDTSDYDLIRGYRADDSYFLFASQFVDGLLSYESLTRSLRLGELGIQIVLKSKESFERIRFIEAVPASPDQYLNTYIDREEKANKRFRTIRSKNHAGTYVDNILDGRADP